MKAHSLLCGIFLVLLLSHVETDAEEPPQRPIAEEAAYEPAVAVPERANRQRRVTCDLLSWGGFNHSLCAAHCLAMLKGFRGGFCDANGVCVCRK